MDKQSRQTMAASLLKEMEDTADRMRTLVVAMPAHDLIAHIYGQPMMQALSELTDTPDDEAPQASEDLINDNQFLLEYVHAVLASDIEPAETIFDEGGCAELYELARNLRQQATLYAMATSVDTKDGLFGPDTADIEFRAKSTWVMIRGHRYQVLEGEFYRYVLAPHNDLLKEVYGVGAVEIAEGFQAMADATRSGPADAFEEMMTQFDAAQAFAAARGKPFADVSKEWAAANADQAKAVGQALEDVFRGGVANVSRHTKLPSKLLADLAYRRGEETEFFAAGDMSGTPYRTLPARKKPLVQLGSDYYAIDPCFARDAGYRALLFNLLRHKPNYRKAFEDRQKEMSEAAFADILSAQLPGATVFREVYYKDPTTKQWSENDTLILLDDVLILVEAKAGAAATIASPALDFSRHAQSVQDLVIKAYKQCERFFDYLNSAEEVPLYRRTNGRYVECGRVRRADYRVMVPIGLTIESFSPFSAYCKELPQVRPLLGKHAFVSLSIDDLFVLKRLLPTPGEFSHYMEVRQAVAAIRKAHLFDEVDHLGAYLTKNRFDLEISEQLKNGKASLVLWDGMSDVVDKSFEGADWDAEPFATQGLPEEVQRLLGALNAFRAAGWLAAESHIRDWGDEARNNLAHMLSDCRQTLNRHPARYFTLAGDDRPLFVWLQRHGQPIDTAAVGKKAAAAALAVRASAITAVVAEATADGAYHRAWLLPVKVPTERTVANGAIYDDAARMAEPSRGVRLEPPPRMQTVSPIKKVGQNDPCPCGSGNKYKKCHGRA